jgi:hypothetical protein
MSPSYQAHAVPEKVEVVVAVVLVISHGRAPVSIYIPMRHFEEFGRNHGTKSLSSSQVFIMQV